MGGIFCSPSLSSSSEGCVPREEVDSLLKTEAKTMHTHKKIIYTTENSSDMDHIDLVQDFAEVNFATATHLNTQSWGGSM